MVADAEGVRHDRQGRVDRPAGHEEAAIHHIEIGQIVGLAVCVQHAGLGIVSETDRADLMGDAGKWSL